LLPVFIPLLIFATSAVESASMQLEYSAQLAIIAAMFFLSLATAPFAIAYALRVSQT
jgi:heme exporter protein B